MIDIRTATQADLDYVIAHPMNDEVTKHFANMKLNGWAKTALLDGDIMGVGGCVVFWKGVAQGWFALSVHAESHKIQMITCIRGIIKDSFTELRLHRLETTIREDFVHAIKLIESAGFKLEGTMKKYTEDGKDAFLYALTI